MVDMDYKKRASKIVEEAKKRGLIKSYSEFCKTKDAKDYALSEEEVIYYTSKHKGEKVDEKV